MKDIKTVLIRTFATIMVVALVMVNFQVDIKSPFFKSDINISLNEAKAQVYDDAELEYHTCWVTGEPFLRCVHGSYVCDVSDQGTCSSTDPEEG